MGPVHGDCHAQNLFVKASQDVAITDVHLIDLATYQSHSLFFFDHAYLELATMLRQMDQLGERRWFEFVVALSRDVAQPRLEPHERGWFEDISACPAATRLIWPQSLTQIEWTTCTFSFSWRMSAQD